MLAIGSKILNRPKDLEVAIRLAETCYWQNRLTVTGIGAEEVWFQVVEKKRNEVYKRLPVGIYRLSPSYSLLRPGEFKIEIEIKLVRTCDLKIIY